MKDYSQPDLAFLLLRASEAEVGISIITSDPTRLRAKLYAERKSLGLLNLSFIQPPVGSESRIWVIKKDVKNGTTED